MKKLIYLIKDRRGFSLSEIILSIGIFASVIFVVGSFRNNISVLENISSQKLQSRQDIEQTIQILTTEIRSAAPSSLGEYPIQSAATSSFVFFSDIDKDGLYERVRYTFVTSTIEKGVVKPSGNPLSYNTSTENVVRVMENILTSSTIPVFQYYDDTYTGVEMSMASPISVPDVRIVKFSVFADINPQKSPVPLFFSQTINIRNLRSN